MWHSEVGRLATLIVVAGADECVGSLTHQVRCIWLWQVVEIKDKHGEPPVRIKVFYTWIDMYLKFLTLQARA